MHKPSLTEQCEKHKGFLLLFDKGEEKLCERCFAEQIDKLKKEGLDADVSQAEA